MSAPPSPRLASSSRQLRLKGAREKAFRCLESTQHWVDWKAAIERLQSLQSTQSSLSSAATSASSSSCQSSRSSISSSATGGVGGETSNASIAATPPSLSPSSSPASSVSSLSSSSSLLLTPEVLLSVHDGFDLLDGTDPVLLEQARVQALLQAEQKAVALKGQLTDSDEWKALCRANEEFRREVMRETEGLRASLGGGWAANLLLPLTASPSPPLTAVEAPHSLPSLMLTEDTVALTGEVSHESLPHNTSASTASTPTLSRRSLHKSAQEEPFTPPSSISSSTQPSPSSSTSTVRPLPVLSHPLPVHSLSSARPSPSTALPSSLHVFPFHPSPSPVLPLIPTTASVAPLHLSQPHRSPSLMAFPPVPSHTPSPHSSLPSSPLQSPHPHPSALPNVPRSAFSSVRSKISEAQQMPPQPLPAVAAPHMALGVHHPTIHTAHAARVVAAHSSTSGRHAAGDPSRLRSPSWCSGLIEDPHQPVPPGGLGLTSPDVHLSLCGSEKHQLQRLWSRMDGRSVLSALLRCVQFDVERNYEHPTPAAVDQLREHLRLTVEGWTDAEFSAALPRHLRTWSRAEYLAKQLSPHGGLSCDIDPAVLWLWRAATPKAPRIYLIQLAPPLTVGTSQGRMTDSGLALEAAEPSQGGLHTLRLHIIGEVGGSASCSPHPSTPCVLIYANHCSSVPHYEAMAWKKGTRGPSRLKTVISYQETIVSTMEAWQRQRQQQRVVARKRRRGEMMEEGGRGAIVQATPAHPAVSMAFDGS